MTNQYEFTNDEWDIITLAPELIGEAIARAADSGFIGELRESRSILSSMASVAADNPAKHLIDASGSVDHKDRMARFSGGTNPSESLATAAVDVAGDVATILGAKATPEETAGYTTWLLEIATSVASTAKENGERISPPEAALIERLSAALENDR